MRAEKNAHTKKHLKHKMSRFDKQIREDLMSGANEQSSF